MAEKNTQRVESDDESEVESEVDEIIERDSEDNSESDSSIDGQADFRGGQNLKNKDETFPSATSDENRLRKRKVRQTSAQRDQKSDAPRAFVPKNRLHSPPKYSVFLQVMLSIVVFSLCLWWSVPFIIICYGEVIEKWTPVNPRKISFVIVGGYGDLAKKYLWQGVHNLDEQYGGLPKSPLLLYSSGRADPEVGEKKTSSALESGVFCAVGDEVCAGCKSAFVRRVHYRQLKTEKHFADLCSEISEATQGHEEGRIFYLSVPPFTYPEIVKFIDLHCRPPEPVLPESGDETDSVSPAWLRVVVEKPFGNDLKTAKDMSQLLLKHLKDEELYRIDHYLGKTTVRNVLPFRHANRGTGIERLLSRDHVEKVEIVVKETDGCKGRMNYYDEYGVVADMLQNHLTEIALMLAMDLPTDLEDLDEIERKKLDVLAAVRPLKASSTVLGQYASYSLEAAKELSSSFSSSSSGDVSSPHRHISITPTFAATALHFDNDRWKDVPFVLMTGKKLDERNGYMKVTFKDNIFCVPSDTEDLNAEGHPCRRRSLIFHIAHGLLKRPSILSSKSLPTPVPISGWREQRTHGANLVHGATTGSAFNVFSANEDEIAYSFLIRSVVKGHRHFFLSDDHLMASWKVWSPLMDVLKGVKPKHYTQNKNQLQNLQFVYLKKGGLRFAMNHADIGGHEFSKYSAAANVPSHFLNAPLIIGTAAEVTSSLSEKIISLALRHTTSNGQFHLALPGGNSPKALLHQLVEMEDFPWATTHIWMVDERLVPVTSPHSNFAVVMQSLGAAPIPYFNVHPISTHLHPSLDPKEIAKLYKKEIKSVVPGSKFDSVILGLGGDGHVASLFPHDVNNHLENGAGENDEADVIATVKSFDKNYDDIPNNRISFNYGLINKADNIFVLALGESKRSIVALLKEKALPERNTLPVDLINTSKTTFCIDDVAWG